MSLINEALRKARQAASEHDSKQPEGPFQPAKAYPSRRRGRKSGPLVMVLIAVAAGVVGASAVWWFLGDHESAPSKPTMGVATPIETPVVLPTPAEDRTERTDIAQPEAQAATPVAIPEPEDTVVEVEPSVIAAKEPVTDSDGNRVFVMEAEVGGASLSLGYIVARSSNPFAEINGTDVWIGSEIEGFVVEAIEPDRVVLRDDKGLLILRVP